MGKYKYYYHPDDNDSDYRLGTAYKGKIRRTILSHRNHARAVEVEFPDGKTTIVHRRRFEVLDSAIEFYPKGSLITIKKVGYMEDRRVTKWVIMAPLKYDLHTPDGITQLLENKRQKSGATNKYQPLMPSSQNSSLSFAARLNTLSVQ